MASPNTLKCFSLDGREKSVQDVVSKLKFISKITIGEIVDVGTLTLMDNTWKTSAYRTILARGESREKTFELFAETTSIAFEMATEYLSDSTPFLYNIGLMIMDAIQESKQGILNHSKTYGEDKMFVARSETLIKTIEAKIKDYSERKHGKTGMAISTEHRHDHSGSSIGSGTLLHNQRQETHTQRKI